MTPPPSHDELHGDLYIPSLVSQSSTEMLKAIAGKLEVLEPPTSPIYAPNIDTHGAGHVPIDQVDELKIYAPNACINYYLVRPLNQINCPYPRTITGTLS